MEGPTSEVSSRPLFTLWPQGAPGGWTPPGPERTEVWQGIKVLMVVESPTVEFFPSPDPVPRAPTVLICPGGGYEILAIQNEGWEVAEGLNQRGIHAALLKYRLSPPGQRPADFLPAWQDAQRAIRLLRHKAQELSIEPEKIGIMGFSAGGHLAAYTSNNTVRSTPPVDEADQESSRPDFTILAYTAEMMKDGTLVMDPSIPVTESTPSAFLVHTMDDPAPIESALTYLAALKAKGVPAEAHFFPCGGHGYGFRSQEPGLREWPDLLADWLKRI